MIPAFARLTQGVLSHLGENAFLRGTVPTRVHVDRDVQMVDRQGNVYVVQTVLLIDNSVTPEPGDAVTVGSDSYKLETRIDDNGYSSRYVALKV